MYHSITFVNIDPLGDGTHTVTANTWDDWHLVPARRPVFSPPAVKEHIIDIPGKDGVLDFTESLTGYPMFERREGSFEFIVMNGYQEWYNLYAIIGEFLHGRKLQAILEDDPDHYYEGRFQISEWRSEKDYTRIVIAYKVDPLRWTVQTASQFNPSSYITEYSETGLHSRLTALILGLTWVAMTAPVITVIGDPIECEYLGSENGTLVVLHTDTLEAGTHQEVNGNIRRPAIYDSTYTSRTTTAYRMNWISGETTVKIDFRRGYI